MEKEKLNYESPEITVTRVELESSICNGSVEFQNPNNDDFGKIEAQGIDENFGAGDDMGKYYSTWSTSSDSSQGPSIE